MTACLDQYLLQGVVLAYFEKHFCKLLHFSWLNGSMEKVSDSFFVHRQLMAESRELKAKRI